MSHIGGVSPGTDEGAMTIRIPSATIAKRSGDGDGFQLTCALVASAA
jgi:hypothetical protein